MRRFLHKHDFINKVPVHWWWIYCGFANHPVWNIGLRFTFAIYYIGCVMYGAKIQPYEQSGTWDARWMTPVSLVWVLSCSAQPHHLLKIVWNCGRASNMVLLWGTLMLTIRPNWAWNLFIVFSDRTIDHVIVNLYRGCEFKWEGTVLQNTQNRTLFEDHTTDPQSDRLVLIKICLDNKH